jgi:hypothetical protein
MFENLLFLNRVIFSLKELDEEDQAFKQNQKDEGKGSRKGTACNWWN